MKNPKIVRSLNRTIDSNVTIHSQIYFYKMYVNNQDTLPVNI